MQDNEKDEDKGDLGVDPKHQQLDNLKCLIQDVQEKVHSCGRNTMGR